MSVKVLSVSIMIFLFTREISFVNFLSCDSSAISSCAGCHGADGKTKALNKSPEIAGLDKDELVKMLKEYKAGTRNVSGMGTLMKGQVANIDDTTIEAVATYISKLK